MVDLVVLQSLSYTAGAISVVLGIIYYAINLREQRRNARITLANSLTQKMETYEFHRTYAELTYYEWKDYDDYEKKYGSDNNLDSYAKRLSIWRFYNSLGNMLKNNMIDADVLYDHGGDGSIVIYGKFEPIIHATRKVYSAGDWMRGFEYLSDEMLKIAKRRDASFNLPYSLKYVPEK